AFGTVWLPYETRCKTDRTSAKARATKTRRNFSQRTIPIQPIGPQTDVLVRFVPFGCIRDRLVALQNSVQNGPNQCKSSCREVTSEFFTTNASNPLDPKLTFWCISYYLCTFGNVWLPYEPRWKTGRTSAKVRATKSRQDYSQRTHPIHPISP